MKNRFLIFVAFVATSFISQGQFLSEVVGVSSSTSPLPLSIVRTHLYDYTVSYGCLTSGNGHLVYSDHFNYSVGILPPSPPRYVTLPSEIKSIWDISTTNTHVHFCGESSNGLGLIGFMKIPDFALSNATVFYVEIPDARLLHHLVAYTNSKNNQDVVAIGYSFSKGDNIIVEFNHILNQTGSYKCAVLSGELLSDVKYTPQAGVVFLGQNQVNQRLSIRKSIPELVVNSPVLNVQYLYTVPSGVASPASDVQLTEMTIAYTIGGSASDEYTTQIRYIDLSTMQMYRSQSYTTNDRSAPVAMTYVPALPGPVMIHEYTLGGTSNSNFLYLDPGQTSTYAAKALYHPLNRYSSITSFGGQFYAACGGNRLYYQDAYSMFPQSTQCIRVASQTITPIESPNVTELNNPVTVFTGKKKFEKKICAVSIGTAILDCKND